MKKVDYIIVGCGYAGIFFAHQLIKNRKTFLLFTGRNQPASQVSAGIVNPVVLKKFTSFWKAQEQIHLLHQTLAEIQEYLGKNYFISAPVNRVFHNEDEKKLWLLKSETPELQTFLSKNIRYSTEIENQYGMGEVLQSGRLEVMSFFADFHTYLHEHSLAVTENFNYDELNISTNSYQDITFKHLVFCEGMGVCNNPFFKDIPVHPNKGHHLVVKLSSPPKDAVVFKKKHFLFPMNTEQWYYGGTYDRDDSSEEISAKAVTELNLGLRQIYSSDYETQQIKFGFRPTVKDRRPILGAPPEVKNLYVFNGLGARGILNASFFAPQLFKHIEFGEELNPEVDLKRFD